MGFVFFWGVCGVFVCGCLFGFCCFVVVFVSLGVVIGSWFLLLLFFLWFCFFFFGVFWFVLVLCVVVFV